MCWEVDSRFTINGTIDKLINYAFILPIFHFVHYFDIVKNILVIK